jgi:hypothetical protein
VRHSFSGERVNMQAVEDQAHARMYDRYPESSVIHWHEADVLCTNAYMHKHYDHEEGVIARYSEGKNLPKDLQPAEPVEKRPSMADGWFKVSG